MVAATIAETVEQMAHLMQTPKAESQWPESQWPASQWPGRHHSRQWRTVKEQGRRRSIPPTALPAPDIEIGLRHPVNCTMPRETAGVCDPVHNRHKKVAAGPWQ